jgi:outer membrane protein TolC
LLGQAPEHDLGQLVPPADPPAAPPEPDPAAAEAATNAAAIRASRIGLEVAQAELTVAESASRPDWDLRAGYALGNDRTGARHLLSLGIQWSAPVGDHGARRERAAAARAELEAATLEVTVEQARIEVEVRNLVAAVAAARERLESLAQAERLAGVVHEKATVGYGEGAVAMRDLLDARQELTAARRDRLAAECELRTRLAELARYGITLPVTPAASENPGGSTP